MRDYTIKVMALQNLNGRTSQLLVKTIEEQTDELDRICLGKVSDLYPLNADCNIEIWLHSTLTETESEDD
jgi:hypothetical protein